MLSCYEAIEHLYHGFKQNEVRLFVENFFTQTLLSKW